MTHDFGTGLVVGKFAPLHRGHQLLIDTARQRCRRVVLLSYSRPEFSGCEPERRRQWLTALYPDAICCVPSEAELSEQGLSLPYNDAPAEEHRQFVAHVCHRLLKVAIDAVFTSEDYGDPFAEALATYYRQHVNDLHDVVHVSVDPLRTRVPISGTALRANSTHLKRWVHPLVRASLTPRVAFLGAESSGKTTLTRAVARALGTRHVEEYGRELWFERGGDLTRPALLEIAHEQVQREERALGDGCDALCCDTSPLTTLVYSQLWYGGVDAELEELAERTYTLTVLCEPDFAFVQDGTRATPTFQRQQHALTQSELTRREISYLVARGPVENRVRQVLTALRERGLLAAD